MAAPQAQPFRDRVLMAPWDAGEPAAAAVAAGADVLADEAPAFDMRFESAAAFFDVSIPSSCCTWLAERGVNVFW